METSAKFLQKRSRAPVLLLLVTTGMLFFLVAGLLWSDYHEQLRKAKSSTRHLATLLASQFGERISRVDAELLALSSELTKTAMAATSAKPLQGRIENDRSRRVSRFDGVSGYHICNADGIVVYSSHDRGEGTVSVAERSYFRQLRDGPSSQAVFSPVLTSRLSGEEVTVMARGLRDERGTFMGVVFATLTTRDFQRQMADADSEKRAVIALKGRDGYALVGLDRGMPAVRREKSDSADLFVEHVADVRQRSMLSPAGESVYPFYVMAGLSRDAVLGGWLVRMSFGCGVCVLVIALLYVLVGRLRRMRQREASILGDLAVSESQFSDLAKLVPVGICRLDTSGGLVFANDCLLNMLGYTKGDLIGREWSGFAERNWRQQDGEELSGQVIVPGVSEYQLRGVKGTLFHVIGETKVECGNNDEVLGYVVALTDISRQKRAEADLSRAKLEAEQANKAKARFLAVASHDLRQPIQAINLFKDALIRADLTGEQRSIARFLSLSVNSLSELLYSLLDFSKLDAGMVQPQKRPIDVEEIFRSVDEAFSSVAQQRNLRFKFFYPFKGLVLYTDPGLLLSVLRNLIDNAFKYTEIGGVLVGVRKREGRFLIQIWDTGVGIPDGVGERIFEECYQVSNPKRDRAKGIGIGLSIARRTARLLEGDVVFRSREGRGSVFEISLPLCDITDRCAKLVSVSADVPNENAMPVDCSIFSGWRVVVVEDDPVVAKSIELSLQVLNMDVDVFGSAEEAVASPRLLGGDFYISDYVLPGENGISLLESIQSRSSSPIRAILMTGATSPERQEEIQSQRWRLLLKPANLSLILSIMSDVVREEEECKSTHGSRNSAVP